MKFSNSMYSRQRGLSLIELMISIALGLTLMAASLQFIVSTRQTYELNDDISRVQENGRIALDILSRDLRLAGYRRPLSGDGKIPDFFLKECTNTAGNAASPCLTEGGTDVSDQLSVQFDPPPDDGTETTCQGTLAPANSIITNVYNIADEDGDGVNSLYCRGYDSTNERWIDPGNQPLVDGIDNMQVLYGFADTAANADNESVTRYISADQLDLDNSDGETDLPNLRSVRVALLVSNGLNTAFSEQRTRQYRLLDSDLLTFTDRQPRRIYSTTVKFNNYGVQ